MVDVTWQGRPVVVWNGIPSPGGVCGSVVDIAAGTDGAAIHTANNSGGGEYSRDTNSCDSRGTDAAWLFQAWNFWRGCKEGVQTLEACALLVAVAAGEVIDAAVAITTV